MINTEFAFWLVGMAVLVLQRLVLGNRPQVWLGAVLPVAWVVGAGSLVLRSGTHELLGWLVVPAGAALLLGLWHEGQTARSERLSREDARIDALAAGGRVGGV